METFKNIGGQWPILSLIECRMKRQPCTQPILILESDLRDGNVMLSSGKPGSESCIIICDYYG